MAGAPAQRLTFSISETDDQQDLASIWCFEDIAGMQIRLNMY